jgi:hypothetical protein
MAQIMTGEESKAVAVGVIVLSYSPSRYQDWLHPRSNVIRRMRPLLHTPVTNENARLSLTNEIAPLCGQFEISVLIL